MCRCPSENLILNFLSKIYQVVLILREILFKIGFYKKRKLGCKVISVGNITLGGTGKTPCVEMLANLIADYGGKVVLISRGYKRKSRRLRIVSDGMKIREERENAGDEPYFLAKTLKNIPVIVSRDRYKAGIIAINKFSSKTIILDDGFQRRYSLYRDLDIVLIDSTNPFGNYRLFPAGVLREPINKLNAADIFILTKVDEAENKEESKNRLNKIKKDCVILESIYKPVCFIRNEETKELNLVKNKKVFLLSSIANPFYFERIIEKLGGEVIHHLKYSDHHEYSNMDISIIKNKFKDSNSHFLITTEKDAVRLNNSDVISYREFPVYSLKIEFEILNDGKEKLLKILKSRGII